MEWLFLQFRQPAPKSPHQHGIQPCSGPEHCDPIKHHDSINLNQKRHNGRHLEPGPAALACMPDDIARIKEQENSLGEVPALPWPCRGIIGVFVNQHSHLFGHPGRGFVIWFVSIVGRDFRPELLGRRTSSHVSPNQLCKMLPTEVRFSNVHVTLTSQRDSVGILVSGRVWLCHTMECRSRQLADCEQATFSTVPDSS